MGGRLTFVSADVGSLAVAVVLLVALTSALAAVARLGVSRDVVVVAARAVVQLFAVGAVIKLVFATPALGPVYVAVMLAAAAYTSGRRIKTPGAFGAAAGAIAAGTAVVALVVFVSGALPFDARNAVPFTAQIIGGSMTATTLAGLRFRDEVSRQWDVVEGWLALGALPAQASDELGRFSASRALVPALDQTRNVGLVVLPGAFVGLLLGGATPLEAGRLQLLVLIGLLAAETVACLVITRLIGTTLVLNRPAEAADAKAGGR
jgi:putative ABC transport system permease protein